MDLHCVSKMYITSAYISKYRYIATTSRYVNNNDSQGF